MDSLEARIQIIIGVIARNAEASCLVKDIKNPSLYPALTTMKQSQRTSHLFVGYARFFFFTEATT
jgi:hypothetical protein